MVEPFLDGRLSGSERQNFVNHVKHCKVCHEELEIYHVIYSVMEELDDESGEETTNYMASLERKLGTSGSKEGSGIRIGAAFGLLLLGAVALVSGLMIMLF